MQWKLQKKSRKESHNNNDKTEEDTETTTHKKKYISPEERQEIIDELRLVPKKDAWIKVNIKKKKKQIINRLKLVQ